MLYPPLLIPLPFTLEEMYGSAELRFPAFLCRYIHPGAHRLLSSPYLWGIFAASDVAAVTLRDLDVCVQ